MQQKSLKKNAILNIIKTIMRMIFPLISLPYASRVLMPEGIGAVSFSQNVVIYFSVLAYFGTNVYGIREASKIRDNKEELSKFVQEILVINIVMIVVSYLLFFLAIFTIQKFDNYTALLIICSSNIFFGVIGIDWLYTAEEDFFYIAVRTIFFQFVSIILLFTLVKEKNDTLWYATISVFTTMGSNVLNFFNSRRYVCYKKYKLNIKKHFKPLFYFFLSDVSIKIYAALDTTILGFFSSDEEVGIYYLAASLCRIIAAVFIAACAVIMPRMSYYAKDGNKTQFKELAYDNIELLLLVSIPSMAMLIFFGKQIVLIAFGQYYLNSIPLIYIMTPIITFAGFAQIFGLQILTAFSMEKKLLLSYVMGAILNIILNLILVPNFMSYGTAISTIIAEITVPLIQMYYSRDIINLKKIISLAFKYIVPTLFMSALVFLSYILIEDTFLYIFIGGLLGVISYVAILIRQNNKYIIFTLNCVRNVIAKNKTNK